MTRDRKSAFPSETLFSVQRGSLNDGDLPRPLMAIEDTVHVYATLRFFGPYLAQGNHLCLPCWSGP
jgi:hypothetical protein